MHTFQVRAMKRRRYTQHRNNADQEEHRAHQPVHVSDDTDSGGPGPVLSADRSSGFSPLQLYRSPNEIVSDFENPNSTHMSSKSNCIKGETGITSRTRCFSEAVYGFTLRPRISQGHR